MNKYISIFVNLYFCTRVLHTIPDPHTTTTHRTDWMEYCDNISCHHSLVSSQIAVIIIIIKHPLSPSEVVCHHHRHQGSVKVDTLYTVLKLQSNIIWTVVMVHCANSQALRQEYFSEDRQLHWRLVSTVDRPRIVHVRVAPVGEKTNLFAQITVRMHTEQVMYSSEMEYKIQQFQDEHMSTLWSGQLSRLRTLHGTVYNPFTPESDQCQISPAASGEIVHYTVWRTWLFTAYSAYTTNSCYFTYMFSLECWENVLVELSSERDTLHDFLYSIQTPDIGECAW